jgi:VWFA-related protein
MYYTRTKALVAGLSLLAGTAVVVFAQKKPEFKVGVNVVNVLATVRDRNGRIVNNLTKDDFILEEDGKPQQITNFFREVDLPLTIGLLVDTSVSQRRLVSTEKDAAVQFFDHVLRPDRDLAFLIQFDSEVLMLQNLTPSKVELDDALDQLDTPGHHRASGFVQTGSVMDTKHGIGSWPGNAQLPGGWPWPGGGRRGPLPPIDQPPWGGTPAGTLLYDAVFLAADDVLQDEAGRKTIIIITDGVDQGSKVNLKDAIETAQRSDCIVFSIRYYDWEAYGGWGRGIPIGNPGGEGYSALKKMSSETGGAVYEVSKKLSLKAIFDQIQEELRSQYSLSYTPAPGGNRGFRKISLRTKDKSLKVLTRTGYYPKNS